MSRQTTLGHFGFEKSIPHRGTVRGALFTTCLFAELSLPLAWIGHEFYGHAYSMLTWLTLFFYLFLLALPFGIRVQLQHT